MLGQLLIVEAGEPPDHLVQLGLRAALALHLVHVERVDRREARGEDPVHVAMVTTRCPRAPERLPQAN